MPAEHVPSADDPVNVEVDVDGAWRPGRLHSWEPRADGLWAEVSYQRAPDQFHTRTLSAERIRPPSH